MSASKHTSAPWQINREKGFIFNAEITAEKAKTANGPYGKDTYKFYAGELICESVLNPADLSLISAAPEMLAALKVAYEFFINPGKFNPVEVERIYLAAIAKAEGRA